MKAIFFIIVFSLLGLTPEEDGVADFNYQLVVFEGSDWCTNCRRLEKNILSDSSMIDFLNKNQIEILKVDFPQRKKLSKKQEAINEALAEKYDFSSQFPEVVISQSGGAAFHKIYYKNQTIQEFIGIIQGKMKMME